VADLKWNVQALAMGQLIGIGSDLLPQVAQDVADKASAYSFAYRLWRHTGELTRSIGWTVGVDAFGDYADVGSVWYGRFLDPKARQLFSLRPLLPSALEVINGRTY
jgi:hypothetical protein